MVNLDRLTRRAERSSQKWLSQAMKILLLNTSTSFHSHKFHLLFDPAFQSYHWLTRWGRFPWFYTGCTLQVYQKYFRNLRMAYCYFYYYIVSLSFVIPFLSFVFYFQRSLMSILMKIPKKGMNPIQRMMERAEMKEV